MDFEFIIIYKNGLLIFTIGYLVAKFRFIKKSDKSGAPKPY